MITIVFQNIALFIIITHYIYILALCTSWSSKFCEKIEQGIIFVDVSPNKSSPNSKPSSKSHASILIGVPAAFTPNYSNIIIFKMLYIH